MVPMRASDGVVESHWQSRAFLNLVQGCVGAHVVTVGLDPAGVVHDAVPGICMHSWPDALMPLVLRVRCRRPSKRYRNSLVEHRRSGDRPVREAPAHIPRFLTGWLYRSNGFRMDRRNLMQRRYDCAICRIPRGLFELTALAHEVLGPASLECCVPL